jgi:hypothetical protein
MVGDLEVGSRPPPPCNCAKSGSGDLAPAGINTLGVSLCTREQNRSRVIRKKVTFHCSTSDSPFLLNA